ncbi:MAG: hypothetical protein ACOC2D_06930 [Spirochaetota bacterium]
MKFAAAAFALVLAALAVARLSGATEQLTRRAAEARTEVALLAATAVELSGYLGSGRAWSPADPDHPLSRAVAERGGTIELEGVVVLVTLDRLLPNRDGVVEIRFLHGRVAGARVVKGGVEAIAAQTS